MLLLSKTTDGAERLLLNEMIIRQGSPCEGVRVSGGHLCVAKAPTEPTGETCHKELVAEG